MDLLRSIGNSILLWILFSFFLSEFLQISYVHLQLLSKDLAIAPSLPALFGNPCFDITASLDCMSLMVPKATTKVENIASLRRVPLRRNCHNTQSKTSLEFQETSAGKPDCEEQHVWYPTTPPALIHTSDPT